MNRCLHEPRAMTMHPNAEALRHKRHGVWLSWSRAAVSARVESVVAGLRERGVAAGSLVVASGDYTPGLALFAVAATRLGATALPLSPAIAPPDLVAWLAGHAPALVFLGDRNGLAGWRTALRQAGRDGDVVVDFHLPWGRPRVADFTFAGELLGDLDADAAPARPDRDVLWVEEGTEWGEGLAIVLSALAEGRAVAFPENRAAAHRDRAEIQPTAIALSPDRLAGLQAELTARLLTGGTIAFRVTRWALEAGRAGRSGWLHRPTQRSLRRPFGLAGLRHLVVDGPRRTAAGDDLLAGLGIVAGHGGDADPAQSTQSARVFA